MQPTLEKDAYADYICSIDKCGQTKHVVLPKLTPEPSEPDAGRQYPGHPQQAGHAQHPQHPGRPVHPGGDPGRPRCDPGRCKGRAVLADAARIRHAQNVVQDAKPEAAVTAAVSAAALPQTGANWLAVVGTALSGLFLLAAGFVLDRKGRQKELRNHL